MSNSYRDLERFSKEIGIARKNLVRAFEIERDFHFAMLKETNRQVRRRMYKEVYHAVHPLYVKSIFNKNEKIKKEKERLVRLFRRELDSKSILDLGCGRGDFLIYIESKINHKRLVGIDISINALLAYKNNIDFICGDIINLDYICEKFDVIFADNVIEHIAPLDLNTFLGSIRGHLSKKGKFIIITPNRLFGPSDVTRIVDYTYTNKIEAMGTHLRELTYTELLHILRDQGFTNFQTVLPIPIIKYYLSIVRFSPKILMMIENSRILNILYRIPLLAKVFSRLLIVLICSRD